MRLLLHLLRAAPAQVLLSSLAGLLSGLATAAMLAYLGRQVAHPGADFPLALYLGLCTLMLLAKLASEQLFVRGSMGAVHALRMRLSRSLLDVPLRQAEEVGPARLLAALTEDVTVITQALPSISSLVVNTVLLLACVVHLGRLSPRLLALFLAFVSVGVFTYRALASEGMRRYRVAHRTQESLHEHLRALVHGGKQLKLHRQRQETFYGSRLTGTIHLLREQLWEAIRLFTASGQWAALLFLVSLGLLLFAAPAAGIVEPSTRVNATVTLLYILLPLGELLNALPKLSRAMVALENLERLGLLLAPSPSSPAPAPSASPAFPRIELRGVTYTYTHGAQRTFTLGPIHLALHPGELVFLVGGNGSGKSTLIKLLLGLYTPESGEILLEGRPVGEPELERYRNHFSAVFADHHLFDGLHGLQGEEAEARAHALLGRFQLEREVKLEGRSFSTTNLSSGQRKRLALLVSLLEERPVLVLDEPAAEQDPGFKEFFYRQLLPELRARGKAVVVVTHDDRYFPGADRTLVLEDGRLRA